MCLLQLLKMKILIWIHRDDVISGKITNYELTRPYHDRNDEWVQVLIDRNKFTRLEDQRFDKVARLEDPENLFKDEEALIFERNPDTGEIRSRKVGDYGNEKIIKKDE